MAKKRSVTIQTGGKGEAVRRRLPDGRIIPICECFYNIDASDGCISQVPVELLKEVVDNDGKYAEGNFRRYKAEGVTRRGRCYYCYAYANTGNVRPRVVNGRTRQDFEKYTPKVIRLGKLTELGHPYYYDALSGILDLCEEFGVGIIFPNKMFPFGIQGARETARYARGGNDIAARIAEEREMPSGEKLAEKLRGIHNRSYGVTLMYSTGWDCFEPGAVSQGFTNQWRIEQAIKYFKEGINTSLTLVCDVTGSIDLNEQRGSCIKSALNAREEGLNVRLLPLRPPSREVCVKATGDTREGVRCNEDPFPLLIDSEEGITGRGQDTSQEEIKSSFPTFSIRIFRNWWMKE